MKTTLIFDMDDTLNKFYDYPHWLELIRSNDPTPYLHAAPKWDMEKLGNVLAALQEQGIEIKVVSWLSMASNAAFDTTTRAAKRKWLKKYHIYPDHCHLVKYGTPKEYYRDKANHNILFDDNAEIRERFANYENCLAIDPNTIDIVEYLSNLLKG